MGPRCCQAKAWTQNWICAAPIYRRLSVAWVTPRPMTRWFCCGHAFVHRRFSTFCVAPHVTITRPTFNDLLKSGLMVVTNCNLSDVQWLPACLPVRGGGLWIHRAAPLALSAFLASAVGSLDLQNEILVSAVVSLDTHVADSEVEWLFCTPCRCLYSQHLPSRQSGTLQPSRQTRPLFRAATVTATTRQGFQLFLHHTAAIGFTHFRSPPAAYAWIRRPSVSQLVWDLV